MQCMLEILINGNPVQDAGSYEAIYVPAAKGFPRDQEQAG